MIVLHHKRGRPPVIVVDGASSSGKTSLLRAFTRLSTEPYRSHSIDGFLPALPRGVFAARAGTDAGWIAIFADFHRHLAEVRTTSKRMIVEVMLPWPEARGDLFRNIGRENIYYVQLYCTLGRAGAARAAAWRQAAGARAKPLRACLRVRRLRPTA
jgi:chloramphenicol 3-O phosphotransferase